MEQVYKNQHVCILKSLRESVSDPQVIGLPSTTQFNEYLLKRKALKQTKEAADVAFKKISAKVI